MSEGIDHCGYAGEGEAGAELKSYRDPLLDYIHSSLKAQSSKLTSPHFDCLGTSLIRAMIDSEARSVRTWKIVILSRLAG